MTFRNSPKFSLPNAVSGAVFCGLLLTTFATQSAQARNGIASYDRHTDEFVTAARYEPRGALLNVVNSRTGRSILVRVNDRGPFNGNRVLDLSTGAFRALFGGLGRGTGPISYQVVGGNEELSSRSGNRYRKSSRAEARRHTRRYRHARRHHRR